MPFLPPNQQRQSTEGKAIAKKTAFISSQWNNTEATKLLSISRNRWCTVNSAHCSKLLSIVWLRFKQWQEHIATLLWEFTKLLSIPDKLIPVILPEFLPVALLTSCYLDATLRIGGREEKEEEKEVEHWIQSYLWSLSKPCQVIRNTVVAETMSTETLNRVPGQQLTQRTQKLSVNLAVQDFYRKTFRHNTASTLRSRIHDDGHITWRVRFL